MSDLFKKLNVLIKANLNDLISHDEAYPRLSKNVEDDIQLLRKRINDAVQYEDEIKARIRQFEADAERWDRQADEAVAQGKDEAARYAIEQMKRAQQRMTIAQSDLGEHQQVTQDLIQKVNTLDAVVADARRSESENNATTETPSRLPDLGNVLRETRDRITSLGEIAAAQRNTLTTEETTPDSPEPDKTIDDDLEHRRDRLSKR